MSIVWTIKPIGTPYIERACSKCSARRKYISSGNFRVNANGRNIDIWLIYKCENCQNTWNMSVRSRVKPESIDKKEYTAYVDNDAVYAIRCAFDKSLFVKNKVVPVYDELEYEISGTGINLDEQKGLIEIVFETEFPFELSAAKALRQKLKLSSSQFKKLVERNVIYCEGVDLMKAKIKNGMVVFLAL